MTKHPERVNVARIDYVQTKRPFTETPRWHPRRWFGYKWRRVNCLSHLTGMMDGYEYWTDKQMAHRAFRLMDTYPEAHTNEHYRE